MTRDRGFTLIELMITLGIIAFVTAVAIPKLGRTLGTELRKQTRTIIILNRQLHHMARLKNKTYRLVVDFGDKEKKTKPNITVESGGASELVENPDEVQSTFGKHGDKAPASNFSKDSEILKHPLELPNGVGFEDVEIENYRNPFVSGKAFIHFFPQGLVQKAAIHITDGKSLHWTLVVNPLTAQTDLSQEYIKLRDLDP